MSVPLSLPVPVREEESGGVWSVAVWSQELTVDLLQLQRQTEQELHNINTQLCHIRGRQQSLTSDLFYLHQRKRQLEEEWRRGCDQQLQSCVCQELQTSITDRLVQSEELLFQGEALSALRDLLTDDLHRYRGTTRRLRRFTRSILQHSHRPDGEETDCDGRSERGMQGKTEENDMQTSKLSPSSQSALSLSTNKEEEEELAAQAWRTQHRKAPAGVSRRANLQRAGSVKDLISRFSVSDQDSPTGSPTLSAVGRSPTFNSVEVFESSLSKSTPSIPDSAAAAEDSPAVPSITVIPPLMESSQPKGRLTQTQTEPCARDTLDSGMGSESELDSTKQLDSPTEDEPITPRAINTSQNPKYQLFLNNELPTNGLSRREADAPGGGGSTAAENGPRMSRWESNRLGPNYRGSLESLTSRDWDTMSDRLGVVDSPPRVFNSPYATAASMDFNPINRMSDFRAPRALSPSTSEMNLYSYNGRSTSPVGGMNSSSIAAPRSRFSTFDTLRRRVEVNNTMMPTPATTHYSFRSNTLGAPNKKDFIEELTKQMDACQKRNQFLEAESVEMEKERNQIRFEMRGLLVNNEDLLRSNSQLNNEMKRMREQMIEMERESQAMVDKHREMEVEVRQARDLMVEANTQEYAFNFLQQSLKNRIQDAEENLEKQTLHAQNLSEKLWLTERQLEELEVDKDTRDKRTSDLNGTVQRLETELSEALLVSTQASAELHLQQKLREDAQLRLEELEETLLEKDQELLRLQNIVGRLQGEVSGKLIDKERTLEEEIQLRERLQLQCKQAERTVDDLQLELQVANQARDETAKQLKQAQEKMLDLETELEELHDSEHRWAAKHKRAIEQTEQLQLKLIQEKDQNDQLESERAVMERQLREQRLEVEELMSSRVQEDVITRAESRAKELENLLRTEERNKAVLTNSIGKLERRINELTDQLEEEHRISNEQKDLMNQRIRSLKRQLNEAEEEASRKEVQSRHTQRELAEERETSGRLQRQLLDQHLQLKRKETLSIRQTLDNLRLDLSVDDEDEAQPEQTDNTVTKV